MPRVSFTTYYERRTKLRQAWKANCGNFSNLSPREQWDLHQYYRFAESLNTDQVCENWTTQHTKSSSLAQRAGRAYVAFELAITNKSALVKDAASVVARKRKRGAKYKVQSIVLPQPDAAKLARVLLKCTVEGRMMSRDVNEVKTCQKSPNQPNSCFYYN